MTVQNRPTGIVWLASYPRSGNTWTRNFLNNLFQVLEGDGQSPQDINALGERTIWDISAARFDAALGKSMEDASRAEIARARLEVHRRIADEANGAVFVKTHNALMLDYDQPTINMGVTSGAIYILRNPLDVAISTSHHFNIDLDTAIKRMGILGVATESHAKVAHEVYGSWSENVMSWTAKPHASIYVMRYEDMLDDPAKTFGELAGHLMIDAGEDDINRAIELSSFEKAKAQEADKGYRERPKQSKAFFREGRAGQWQDVLSADQVKTIITDHREQMSRFGYIPDGH